MTHIIRFSKIECRICMIIIEGEKMAQTKKKTSATAKTTAVKKSSAAKSAASRKTTSAKRTAKNSEPIIIARTQKNEGWKPLAKANSGQSIKKPSTSASPVKARKGAKKPGRKRMTDSKLAAITITSVFAAVFLIVLLVFLFNAFDLKIW